MQPVESEGGPIPCVTTYSAYFAVEDKARVLMELTASPNAVVMSSGTVADRNAAVHEKIRLVPSQRSDTLFVRVDVPMDDLPPAESQQGWLRNRRIETAAITLWCGLRNARTAWPKTRYVRYEVHGTRELDRYTGLYPLEAVVPPVSESVWDMKSFRPAKR